MTDETIFATALEKANPVERAAFLAKACGDDTARRTRLEGLLMAHAHAANFLEHPPIAAYAPDQAAPPALAAKENPVIASGTDPAATETLSRVRNAVPADHGSTATGTDEEPLTFLAPPQRSDSLGRIGHYEVLQILGRGSFGIVFRAFDEMLQRVVALKIMAQQLAATSPARKRFLREARSSAQVRHENVTKNKPSSPAIAPFTDADVQHIAALPVEQQVEEVRKELMRRNPGFDGKGEHRIEDGVVTEFRIVTDKLTGIAPIRVLKTLRVLDCNGTSTNFTPNGQLADLAPLKGMKLAGLMRLDLHETKVTDAGMVYFNDCKDLKYLNLTGTKVSDVGPGSPARR